MPPNFHHKTKTASIPKSTADELLKPAPTVSNLVNEHRLIQPSDRVNFSLAQCDNQFTAMGYCMQLAMFDGKLSSMRFSSIANEIFACINHNQYAIVSMPYEGPDGKDHDTPVGYILWGLMSAMSAAIYAKRYS